MESCEQLREKFKELEAFHHHTLHELADAAQIIVAYEYLHQRKQRELQLLKRVLTAAEALVASDDLQAFQRRRRCLLRAIRTYQTHLALERESAYPEAKRAFSAHWHSSNTTQSPH